MRMIALIAFAILTAASVVAAEPLTFKDRRITIIVGYAPGGGADTTARLVMPILATHLPGNPAVVVQNMPGAEGIKALNYFATQVKPDGLTIYVGSANEFDPVRSRSSVALYNLNKLSFIGGNARFQSAIVIKKSAKNRLYDKSSRPVTMGTAGFPRSGAQTAAWGIEYLGWHVKWVTGYKGSPELVLALDRGEIDMTASNEENILKQIRSGNLEVVTLTGKTPIGMPQVPEFANAPQLTDQIAGKIYDPTAKAAFEYWETISSVDKWLALPAGTPKEIVDAYRSAFSKVRSDPEFTKRSALLDLVLTDHRHFENAVKILGQTPQAAINFMASLLRKQGLEVAK